MIALKVGPQPKSFKAGRDYSDVTKYRTVKEKDDDGNVVMKTVEYTVRRFHPSDKVRMQHDFSEPKPHWNGHSLRTQMKRNGIARGTTAPLPKVQK
jgi:hypothetical protein